MAGLAALWLAACAGGGAPPPPPQSADLYVPPWPAQPQFQFEGDLRAEASLHREDPYAGLRAIAGAPAVVSNTAAIFGKPTDVAAHGGRIYVTDVATGGVHVFDVPRRKLFRLGMRTNAPATRPLSIDVDGRGHVYVADAAVNTVYVYDSLGLFLRRVGETTVEAPLAVAVGPLGNRIYVVDGGTRGGPHRVAVFDDAGTHLFDIGRRGDGPGQLNFPVDAATSASGVLYVLDAGNFRVQAFDETGRHLRTWGSAGTGLGQFAKPRHIAVDPQGRVYVSDAAFGNVQVFASDGRPLFVLGQYGDADEPARFGLAGGIDIDETGRLYVLDQYFRKLEVYRPLADREKLDLNARRRR